MKKFTPFIVLLIVLATTLFIGVKAVNRISCNQYIVYLQKEGYSSTWAIHKANVEYGYLEPDELYQAIEED
jgi:hypothetical protein